MRRKSERNKARSPEKRPEKSTRRTRRRKGTPDSEDDRPSDNETLQELKDHPEAIPKNPSTDSKESNSNSEGEGKQESVWQVKSADAPSDTGEIQKLKICLQRPSSSERSPRKHHGSSQESADSSEEVRKKRSKKHSHSKDDNSDDKHENQDNKTVESKTDECAMTQSETKMEITDAVEQNDKSKKADKEVEVSSSVVNNDNDNKESDSSNVTADVEVKVESSGEKDIKNDAIEVKKVSTITEEKENKSVEQGPENSEEVAVVKEEVKEEKSDNSLEDSVAKSDEKIMESAIEKTENSSENETTQSEEISTPSKGSEDAAETKSVSAIRRKSLSVEENNKSDNERTESVDTIESSSKNESSNVDAEKVTRKRKWGSKHSMTSEKKPAVAISTDSLKNLISDVKPLSVNDVLMEEKNEKGNAAERKTDTRLEDNKDKLLDDKLDMSEMDYEADDPPSEKESERSVEIEKKRSRSQRSESEKHEKLRKRISVNENVPEKKSNQPAQKTSEILYITNLVRPFTVLQLKGLLARTGKLIENGFWIDNIKSRCFVRYENEDQAFETRHALHGTRWPASNPKLLHVEFSTSEEMEKCLSSLPPPPPSDNIRRTIDSDKVAMAWLTEQNFKDERVRDREALRDRKQSVREWDLGKHDPAVAENIEKYPRDAPVEYPKETTGRDRRDERFDNRDKRRSRSRSPVRRFKRKEDEAPAKRLDDLFRKTKVTPCIYWLPLTPEQIAVKEEMRRQHMAEHERRKEEIRKQEREREKERQSRRERRNSSIRDRNRRNSSRSRDRNNH